MGNILVGNRRDLYNPLRKPDTSGLIPNITGIAPNALNNTTLVPGDVVQLDGSSVDLSFDYEISGFSGTPDNPIWILGNGSTYNNRAVEMLNNEWVYFEDLAFMDSNNNGLLITESENCIYNDFTLDGMALNGVRVDGSTNRPNNRLAFFNFGITNWGGSDAFSLHASSSEEDNGSFFIIKDLVCQNPVDTGEDGLDLTSGDNVYVWGYIGTDARAHIAHGVKNIYIYDFEHNFDPTSGRDQSIEFKNTDGDIWVSKVRGNGQIDLGLQTDPRTNESPNSTLSTQGNPLYLTYELQIFDNQITGGIDNNTSAQGTIVTDMAYNKLGYLDFSGFSRWPNTI